MAHIQGRLLKLPASANIFGIIANEWAGVQLALDNSNPWKNATEGPSTASDMLVRTEPNNIWKRKYMKPDTDEFFNFITNETLRLIPE